MPSSDTYAGPAPCDLAPMTKDEDHPLPGQYGCLPAESGPSFSTAVLVIGGGVAARTAARELAGRGHRVVLLAAEALGPANEPPVDPGGGIAIWAPADLLDFEGAPGSFRVAARLDADRYVEMNAGAVIVASDCRLSSPFQEWGLAPSDRVLSLSGLEETLLSPEMEGVDPRHGSGTWLLICGFSHHSHPMSQGRAMQTALRLATGGKDRVILLLDHAKVAEAGLERLYRRARDAGVLFARTAGAFPKVRQDGDRIRVSYDDEALGARVSLSPDRLVLEEAYAPPPQASRIAALLGIHIDAKGFFQGDNAHNQPIFTNRTGIWVAGQAKGPVSDARCVEEACAAAHEASRLLDPRKAAAPEGRILLNTRKCAVCLTCYRLCPHRAVSYVHRRPVFSDLACRSCGICTAGCPMDAIRLNGAVGDGADGRLTECPESIAKIRSAAGPRIIAFCCRNSACEAARGAKAIGADLPEGLHMVQVPCAGIVDPGTLLQAFRDGADGVMVLACHHESCKSVDGSRLAARRVNEAARLLEEAGASSERLYFGTLAPATPMDFAASVFHLMTRIRYGDNHHRHRS